MLKLKEHILTKIESADFEKEIIQGGIKKWKK